MIKTVNVLVHVDQWAGPNRVDFSFQLESEPVMGTGTYTAAKKSDKETEIRLKVQVEGSGQAALMWEAVSRPLLPQMAKTFASKLRLEIECLESVVTEHPEKLHALNRFGRLRQWLRNMWRALLERC